MPGTESSRAVGASRGWPLWARTCCSALAIGSVVVASAALSIGASAGVAAAAGKCRSSAVPGDQTVPVDGAKVLAYFPARYHGERVPLVIDLHGSSQSGKQEVDADGIRALADKRRFAVVAPDGAIPFGAGALKGWTWNIPGVPIVGTTTYPDPGARDDVRFVSHAIDAVSKLGCIDATRIYATGVSGGGRMASQLACDLSNRIAAIAPISGVRFPQASDTPPHTVSCDPARPVPVIAIHGAWDPVNVLSDTPPADAASLPAAIRTPVPGSYWSYSAETAVERWAKHNGCRARPRTRAISPNIDEVTYQGCHRGATVELYKVKNSGHASPGHEQPALTAVLNPTSNEVDGTVVAWSFLSRYRLPSPAR
jgi:polyhydroxybutyrate depolymerase